MAGINKVIIVGRLGQDPEMKAVGQGSTVTRLNVATSESWVDKNGQKQERTEWHRIVLFNRIGEVAAQYLRKGSRVFVEGSLRTNKWQDQSGNERYTTEIIANSMQLMDSKGTGGEQTGEMPEDMQSGDSAPRAAAARPMAPNAAPMAEEFDDDIPF